MCEVDLKYVNKSMCACLRTELRLDHQTKPERTGNIANDNNGLQEHCTGNNKMVSMGAITELLEWLFLIRILPLAPIRKLNPINMTFTGTALIKER